MRSDVFFNSFVVVLCLCGVLMAAEPNDVPGSDANDVWVAAEHLLPGWQYMELTTRHYNPEDWRWASDSLSPRVVFHGQVEVADPNGLIGLCTVPRDILVLDEEGRTINTALTAGGPVVYEPLRFATIAWVPTGDISFSAIPYEFSIDMSLYPPYPLAFAKIQWSMDVLLSDFVEAIDIPFASTTDWIELTPGLEVLVVEAVHQGDTFRYTIQTRYDPKKIAALQLTSVRSERTGIAMPSWPAGQLPEKFLIAAELLSADGKQVLDQRLGGDIISVGANDTGDPKTGTWTVFKRCSTCGSAGVIRHVIAWEPYERRVPLELENILVPEF